MFRQWLRKKLGEYRSKVENRLREEFKQRLGEMMFGHGEFLVLSNEEFVLRLHVDDFNHHRVVSRDVWWLKQMFQKMQLAYFATADAAFDTVLANLEKKGLIQLSQKGDHGISTILYQGSIHNLLGKTRHPDFGEVLGVGSFHEECGAKYLVRKTQA